MHTHFVASSCGGWVVDVLRLSFAARFRHISRSVALQPSGSTSIRLQTSIEFGLFHIASCRVGDYIEPADWSKAASKTGRARHAGG